MGKVTAGMDVVEKVAAGGVSPTAPTGAPLARSPIVSDHGHARLGLWDDGARS